MRCDSSLSGPVGDRRFFLVDDTGEWFGGDAHSPLMLIQSSYDAGRDELELLMPGRTGRRRRSRGDRRGDHRSLRG